MSSRWILGLWEVKMWGYWWGYTQAQIELGMVDCPIVVYDRVKDDTKMKGGKKGDVEFEKPDWGLARGKMDAWEKKHGSDRGSGVRVSLEGLKLGVGK